ncbi:DUF2306 domain-containing protein [Microbacterium gallinarum]|jgi:uncharacterized membrane protein|uniref:DUF2306 domain-containing protein n=1 Tax=Microbacterium gallinarum TaxID=2762209 RepID=A0ABR8WZG7_9MICO|nr:DUF2306 domain-containing protein [Microbacterium gallinarum]MBD8022487.1 DUF2306 domain-containing protein [Microbacterium gallinarum]
MTRLIEPVRTAPVATPVSRASRRVGWAFVLLSALAVVAFSALPYFTASLRDLAGDEVGLAPTYAEAPMFVQAAFYVHIVGGATALVLGALQFWRGLRERAPRVHRWTGRLYLAGVAVGGVAGLIIAPSSPAGYVGFFGFGALAVLWLITGWRAYRAIRRGDVPSHQAWMIRNYSLTYAGVTLRLWLPLLLLAPLLLGQPWEFDAAFANAYAAVPFLCWLPNLVVAEWLVRRRGLPSYRLPVTGG